MDPGSSKRIRGVGWIQEAKTLDPKHQNAEEHNKAWAHIHMITGEGITGIHVSNQGSNGVDQEENGPKRTRPVQAFI
jgi:hypothetical protein